MDLAGPEVKGDAVVGHDRSEALADVAHFDDRRPDVEVMGDRVMGSWGDRAMEIGRTKDRLLSPYHHERSE